MEYVSPRRKETGGSFTGDRRKLIAADVKKDGEKASSI